MRGYSTTDWYWQKQVETPRLFIETIAGGMLMRFADVGTARFALWYAVAYRARSTPLVLLDRLVSGSKFGAGSPTPVFARRARRTSRWGNHIGFVSHCRRLRPIYKPSMKQHSVLAAGDAVGGEVPAVVFNVTICFTRLRLNERQVLRRLFTLPLRLT